MSLKSFKDYVPYLSGLIIILGLIRQIVYYHHYDIEIQNYIGVSELLLAWVDELLIFSFAMFIFLINSIFSLNDSSFKLNILGKIGIPLFTLLLCYIFTQQLLANDYVISTTYLILIFIVFFPMAGWIINGILNTHTISLANFKFSYFSVLVILVLVLITRNSINKVENGKYIGTKIFTEDSTYISDINHFYVGKTESFYFIYNKEAKTSLAIPEREVFKFEMKKNIPVKVKK